MAASFVLGMSFPTARIDPQHDESPAASSRMWTASSGPLCPSVANSTRRANHSKPSSHKIKNISLYRNSDLRYQADSPRHREGRFAIVTEQWRGLRWTLRRQVIFHRTKTLAAYGEVVWSWRRDPGVYPLRLCGDGNGDNKGRSPGRARISRKTIARGKPGCLGCTCQTRVHSFSTSAHGDAGAVGARLSLRPLFKRGTTRLQDSGEFMP